MTWIVKQQMTKVHRALRINRTILRIGVDAYIVFVVVTFIVFGVNEL